MSSPAFAPHAVATELTARGRTWTRRSIILDRGSLLVSLLAAVTEAIVLIGAEHPVGSYIGLAFTLLGIAVTRNYLPIARAAEQLTLRLWIGATLIVLGPLVATLLGGEPLVTWTIAVFTAFSITLRGLPGVAVGVFIGIGVYLAVTYADNVGYVNATAFVALAMSFTAAASGSALRNYVRLQKEFEQRALDALASRDAEANQRVTEERLRIARDLHDLVGHEVAVLGIHLGVAEVNLPADANTARSALESARENVQSVLLETQRILHVLRDSTSDGTAEGSTPAADYGRIPDLVATFRDAGMDVRLHLAPQPDGINPEVSTATYRVIQEALTNAQRHGSGPTTVSVSSDNGMLTISASNAITPTAPDPGGHRGYGLVGMRERVTSAGGQLRIDNGHNTFAVTAVLQIDGRTL